MIQLLKALIYPPKCIVCGQILDVPLEQGSAEYFCPTCTRGILEEPQSFYCEESLEETKFIVKGLFPYIDHYKQSVLRWKYRGIRKYAKGYGQAMSLMDLPWEKIDALIPVPISRGRYQKRGFNQALDLAEVLSGHTGIPTYDILQRTRNTKPQSACTKKERATNIKGSIGIKAQGVDSIKEQLKNVAIIDDIYTTGSTVKECAKILEQLEQLKIDQIYILVVSRGM